MRKATRRTGYEGRLMKVTDQLNLFCFYINKGDYRVKLFTTLFPDEVGENSVDSDKDLLSIGEECEEWSVQKVSTQNILIKEKD